MASGQVEKNVQDARRRLWQPMPNFPHIDALNEWLEDRCVEQWGMIPHGELPGSVADVHAAEVARLMPMGRAFDGFVEHSKRVSPTCLITFDRQSSRKPEGLSDTGLGSCAWANRMRAQADH
jgi:hypothetical protein